MLSNSDTEFMNALYSNYKIEKVVSRQYFLNISKNQLVKELIIRNY